MAQNHNNNRQSNANSSSTSRSAQPLMPETMPPMISVQGSLQAPPPQPLRLDSLRKGRWRRDQERERSWQQERSEQRQEYLWRKLLDIRFERQRLNAEEQALQQAWDALPQPTSHVSRLIIVLVMIAGSITLVAFYPALILPLIIVLLIMVKIRRRNRWRPETRTAWIAQEHHRIESRVAWIDARIAALTQEERAISSDLLALSAQPIPER